MNPQRIQSLFAEAVAHHKAGRLERAEPLYRQVRQAFPGSFDLLHLSGMLAHQRGRADEAVQLLERALKIKPDDGPCRVRLGFALLGRGEVVPAEKNLRAGLVQDPSFVDGWEGLALCLKMQDRLPEALQCHERVVALRPNDSGSWTRFGLSLSFVGRYAQALGCHDRALSLDPRDVEAHFGRAQALQQGLRLEESVAELESVIAADPTHAVARSYRLLGLQHLGTMSREALFEEHKAFGRAAGPAARRQFKNSRDAGRKLRIALISPDLRRHSCAYFIEPLLEHLDRQAFEVFAYLDHFREDEVSARLRSHCASWRKVVGLSDSELERWVLADAPDIALDIAGHAAMTPRMRLFARRLAPVQITYLGYPDTTGLAAMDFRFTDAVADPGPEADRFATEELVRLPGTAWTYRPPEGSPAAAPASTAGIRFGCFNYVGKINDASLGAWSRLLSAVPDSRLVLKGTGLGDPAILERFKGRLARAGIAADRVDLLDHTPALLDHLALYNSIDIALDTFPYNGTTTTCEALWMGVPVVTLRGASHASRVGASLLSAAGHPEWVGDDVAGYVSIASALVRDRRRLLATKTGLRSDLMRGPLLDHSGQASRFGAALRACWGEYCEGRIPRG